MNAVLELDSISFKRGRKTLFSNLCVRLAPGQLLRIEGQNGAGKTTLMRVMAGLLTPDHGSIQWRGQNVARLRDEFNAELLYLGHAPALKQDLSAFENLEFAAVIGGDQIGHQQLREALKLAGLGQRLDLPARMLSQGQRRRCALARLELARERPVWILDEPYNALDNAAIGWLSGLIDQHLARGGAVALSTHQAQPIAAWHGAEVLAL